MSTHDIQAQWSLDQSAGTVLGVSRGMLRAATTDNVQVLAILACERFGATLAISHETRLKIERIVLPTPEPAVLSFLKATVGFSNGDCASHLGKSFAGVQFLGLATALITSMSPFTAASAIQGMLLATATDQTLIPTSRQIQDLLSRIEPRCVRSGFMDEVIGWHELLKKTLLEKTGGIPTVQFQKNSPQPQGIQSLVDAFRQLHRIGNTDVSGITIRYPFKCVPWIITFTKWCLGAPPTVLYLGEKVISQPDSAVNLDILGDDDSRSFGLSIYSKIGTLTEIISPVGNPPLASGMISVPAYGQQLFQGSPYWQEVHARRALEQAAPYALRQVLELMIFSENTKDDPSIFSVPIEDLISLGILRERMHPFPDDDRISKMYSRLIGAQKQVKLKTLEDGHQLSDLSLVSEHLQRIEKECDCVDCQNTALVFCSKSPPRFGCRKQQFWSGMGHMILQTLCLSLFIFPEDLRLWSGAYTGAAEAFSKDHVEDAMCRMLARGEHTFWSLEDIMEMALEAIGHLRKLPNRTLGPQLEITKERRSRPVVTCFQGQAVWLSVFETYKYHKRGSFTLSWHPGILKYRNETYEKVVDNLFPLLLEVPAEHSPKQVNRVCNLFPSNSKLEWQIVANEGNLEAMISEGSHLTDAFSPTNSVYHTVSNGLWINSCPHPANAELSRTDRLACFTTPLDPYDIARRRFNGDASKDTETTHVVAVEGNDDLRFIALAVAGGYREHYSWVVLRNQACLKCCLNQCKRANARLLIL